MVSPIGVPHPAVPPAPWPAHVPPDRCQMPPRGPAPEWVALLNTSLIVISGVFLLIGYYFIRQRQIELHKRSMLTATVFAALFLVVYVTRAVLFETSVSSSVTMPCRKSPPPMTAVFDSTTHWKIRTVLIA